MVQNCLLLLKKYSPEFYDILIKTNKNKMNNFDLRKYLVEGKLLKENMNLTINDDYDDRDGMEFDEDNWKDILDSNHAFVEIASKIPTEVEALDDYVMITVNLEDLKTITS